MEDQNTIKFIYFDVGGVVLLDFSKNNKWDDMLKALGITDELRSHFDQIYDLHEPAICRGENLEVFMKEFEEQSNFHFPNNYDMTQDFVDRFDQNQSMTELIKRLKASYRLGLLTNQYPGMLQKVYARKLTEPYLWDVTVDSSVEGISKPGEEIFILAEKRANVPVENILYIDNSSKHLGTAKARGWMTFEYDPAVPEQSTAQFEEFISTIQANRV